METEKRNKIYMREVAGRFRRLRSLVSFALLAVYFALPWVRYNGAQAVLFDIPGRKFHVFNFTFWPEELYYLAFALVFLVIALFFFTAVAGRLWCGYACPQTVFTDIFMWIERLIEGGRRKRMELDGSSLSGGKAARKIAKHAVWLAFSFATAFAFVSYFIPPMELLARIATGSLTGANAFWLGLFTFTTYGDCAFLRELMCLVPCPYGRFQSALFDQDTLIIGYDPKRGEPRAHGKARKDGAGDCVDCTLCVQACPTGIDIRDGLQYECIACAQCIDACDSVMRKMGLKEGLIRYGSLRTISGGTTKVLRPRVILYGFCLAALFSLLTWKLATRTPLEIEVLRDRASLYQKGADGRVTNLYTIKAMNMDSKEHTYRIKTEGIDASIVVGRNPVTVRSGEVYQTALALVVDRAEGERVKKFDFVLEDAEDPGVRAARQSTFLIPEGSTRLSRAEGEAR
ncbi:MAG: cytochrome c oxidase accessory protein CcoG [Deltaproteobacteria bacterium]|nr:cytochrome c oxidase accessory protein CcoG [Deltaproteobacteria bacterium]